VSNADDRFLGPLLPRRALAGSRNVPAVNLLGQLGLDAGYDFFRALGLHRDERPAGHWGLGMAIGGFPVTMRQLATAYGALATDGRLRPLRWMGHEPQGGGRRVFSPHVVWQITQMLSDPLARLPSFPRMGFGEYPFPVAVKTGTSSGYRDAWAVAWSGRWLVLVWVGHPDFQPMNALSGYRVGANLASTVMMDLHREEWAGLSDISRVAPDGITPVEVCGLSGQRAQAHCAPVSTEWLTAEQQPTSACTVHQRRVMDRCTGGMATAQTPPSCEDVVVFVSLPGRHASWAAQQGLQPPPLEGNLQGEEHMHRLRIQSPQDGAVIFSDPESPRGRSTLALRVSVDPPVDTVLWLHNGEPLEQVGYPHALRWPLTPGTHRFQVMLPQTGALSDVVEVTLHGE
jgi:penicillin-binding protein 1C